MLKKMRRTQGLTLVELLVVVLILGILLAVAIPLYLQSVKQSALGTCQGNIQTLANEAQAYKTKSASRTAPADDTAFQAWLTQEGMTPVAGPYAETYTYAISSGVFTIKCNGDGTSSHGTYTSTTGAITGATAY